MIKDRISDKKYDEMYTSSEFILFPLYLFRILPNQLFSFSSFFSHFSFSSVYPIYFEPFYQYLLNNFFFIEYKKYLMGDLQLLISINSYIKSMVVGWVSFLWTVDFLQFP